MNKRTMCKNKNEVTSKFCQYNEEAIYYINDGDDLIRVTWRDINTGQFGNCFEVSKDIIDFALQGNRPVLLRKDHTLTIEDGSTVDLKTKTKTPVNWSVLEVINERLLVGGSIDDSQGYVRLIDEKGKAKGKYIFPLLSNGYSSGEILLYQANCSSSRLSLPMETKLWLL